MAFVEFYLIGIDKNSKRHLMSIVISTALVKMAHEMATDTKDKKKRLFLNID